jgi:CMP-N,N'-diacetyllegionaminic acid synthase
MRTIGLIPARGGSSRIPRKAIKLLAGKPLLAYTADSARGARRLARVVLSTDDREIAAVGRRLGLDVPFMRPHTLAAHDTPMLDTVRHAILALERDEERIDAVCLLQPTAPLRTAQQIDACINLLDRSGADAVVTIIPVPHEFHPAWAYRAAPDGALRLWDGSRTPITRRQALEPAFCRSGDVYVIRRDVIIEHNSLYGEHVLGYPIDPHQTVNLNEPEDWARAEQLLLSLSREVTYGHRSRTR